MSNRKSFEVQYHPYSPVIEHHPVLPSLNAAMAQSESVDLEDYDHDHHIPHHNHHQRLLLVGVVVSLGLLSFLIHNYELLKLSVHHLWLSVAIGSVSSVLAQMINQFYKRHLSWSHLAKFVVWGSINGVFTSLWIDLLFVQFPQNVVVRVLVDQLVGSPLFQLLFLVLNAIWDNNNDIFTYLKVNYWKSLKLSYLIWPSFSLLSFSILPPELIFPCNCVVNLFWNVILSFIS